MDSGKIVVVITGGAGRISYSLIPLICSGSVFSSSTKIVLKLLDIPSAAQILQGVKMEIEDSGYELVESIMVTTSPEEAFTDADVAILLGGFPRLPGMERKDLIDKNIEIMQSQATSLERYASKNVKVLVVANPANTNCMVAALTARSIPSANFSCLTRLDEERLKNLLAERLLLDRGLRVSTSQIRGVCIFGNHSSTQVPYTGSGEIFVGGIWTPIRDLIDPTLLATIITSVQQRGAAIMNAQKNSSALSAAAAIGKHLKSWLTDSAVSDQDIFSMGVLSDGESYGIPTGIFCSLPCRRNSDGEVSVVTDLPLDESTIDRITLTVSELLSEQEDAFKILSHKGIVFDSKL